jgi:hypothetical protein
MPHSSSSVEEFVARWKESGAGERANFQPFVGELCDVLGVARPEPAQADDEQNAYVFERAVTFHNPDGSTSAGRIDLYKRGCFVMEAKQGSDRAQAAAPLFGDAREQSSRGKARRGAAVRGTRGWDVAMRGARGQAEQYVCALPPSEGNPPFLVVVDVGYSFELYSDFSRAGKTYVPFPDARGHRVLIEDLSREDVRETLRQIWTDPLSLDPSRRSARVTRGVAEQLAALARSLEESGYAPERVASFLMRAIFTMFAEDVGLIPHESFTEALANIKREGVEIFADEISSLWATMNTGGYTSVLKKKVIQFNGGLFEDCEELPLDPAQLDLLIAASRADWKDVEPAIFGTLLERALNPRERHKLGAHYTPRAYVERLVMPTIIEPLRQEWADVLVAATKLANEGKLSEAAEEAKAFHRRLCRVRVLDPACGSGNFLYVTLEHLKRLEGEVLDALHGFGESQGALEDTGLTVDPHQLLGIEVNPRAAAITDLVLWIGYLQWHFRTRGEVQPPQPVIKKFHNIECRDAVLAYDGVEEVSDDEGRPVTRWDGRTYKRHPVTGEDVPDETARAPLLRYINPRKAVWPEADFIVGNPPFVGNWRMRSVLGDGYVQALRSTYGDVPESSDFVMYWWEHAAELLRDGKLQRFGFIATNSLRQTFNRKVLERHLTAKNPLSLVFAVPDHPWVDEKDGAAVRISMTVAEAGEREGVLAKVANEVDSNGEGIAVELTERDGKIFADLTIGANVAGAEPLRANQDMSCPGVKLHGAGFIVTSEQAENLGLGRIPELERHIRNYRNGRDVTGNPRGVMVIDLFGLTEDEVRRRYPEVYQWIYERVKPERDQNKRASRRDNWWVFGEPISTFRPALEGLDRFISTPETAKHRFFVFLDGSILPDNMLTNIALTDAFFLGVLSSHIHVTWALASGGTLEDRPRYNKTRCFDPFPFPVCDEQQKERIRGLGESLDAHRKRQQAQNPQLTITEMYNVLEKLRRGEPLNDRERATHEQGLVSVLRQIHDELDAAVFDAYSWPSTLSDEEILERLVRLNAERAAEERSGLVRWLRPEFQKPAEGVAAAFGEEFAAAPAAAAKHEKQPWPKALPEQARAVRLALAAQRGVVTPQQLARAFTRARVERIEELLQTLVSLGQAREVGKGRYTS